MSTSNDAQLCLDLAYKYGSLRGCVLDQCPGLMRDPMLALIHAQIEILSKAFDARVHELAWPAPDDGG